MDTPLTAYELAVLDFEREWWRFAGAKAQAIKARFDLAPAVYYRDLGRLIDDERAMGYDRMLVMRLRRMRGRGRLA